MKTFILGLMLALTAVSGVVVASQPAVQVPKYRSCPVTPEAKPTIRTPSACLLS